MLVFRPVSLLEPVDQKSLSFSFEDDIDYQDDDGDDELESKYFNNNSTNDLMTNHSKRKW